MSSVASIGPVLGEGKVAMVAGNVSQAGTIVGNGFTAVVGAGDSTGDLYTITFSKKYKNLISCVACCQLAAVADFNPQIVSWTTSTSVLVLKSVQGGTGVNLTAGTDKMHFICVFELN